MALRHVHMIYKHNLLVGLFGNLHAVHGFYFCCRNALGLIATYLGLLGMGSKRAVNMVLYAEDMVGVRFSLGLTLGCCG